MYSMRELVYYKNQFDIALNVVKCAKRHLLAQGVYSSDYEYRVNSCKCCDCAKRHLLAQGVYSSDYEYRVNSCSKCPKIFNRTSTLRKHFRSHRTNVRFVGKHLFVNFL